MRNAPKIFLTLIAAGAASFALCGCSNSDGPPKVDPAEVNVSKTVTSTTTTEVPKAPDTSTAGTAGASDEQVAKKLPPDDKFDPKIMPKVGDKVAVITTNYGVIVFKFLSDVAPNTSKNFQTLADKQFFDGTKFHRVIPDFMIQGGDPNSKDGGDGSLIGQGGPGYTIQDEFSTTHHQRGIVSMAHTGEPNSAGSQFFICVSESPSVVNLDGKYAAFGRVIKGMNVVDKIVNLPTGNQMQDMPNTGVDAIMKTVRIETWPLK